MLHFSVNGIQEVSGSIPLISTNKETRKSLKTNGLRDFLFFMRTEWKGVDKTAITSPVTSSNRVCDALEICDFDILIVSQHLGAGVAN